MKHEKGVRVYGATMGHSSAAQITKGAIEGLKALDLLAGVVPVDAFDEMSYYPGAMAEVGVLFGPPIHINMLLRGAHRRNYVMLAPNSSWVPESVLRSAEQIDDELQKRDSQLDFVAPSQWGAVQIRRYWHRRRVDVWRHGVADVFRRDAGRHEALRRAYEAGKFKVLHLTSSAGQRKGTVELIRAWKAFLLSPQVEDMTPQLTVVAEPGRHHEDVKDMAGGTPEINVVERYDLDAASMARFYQEFHVVCQPSRGEGFGLVPLEARACGVPVVMTAKTGHMEHVCLLHDVFGGWAHRCRSHPGGATVVIKQTETLLLPIDDGPGAVAPALEIRHVHAALLRAAIGWPELAEEGALVAQILSHDQSNWSWRTTTAEWLKTIEVDDE